MLQFFRKIRQSLLESGSFKKYLLYAIGEIALVVIGILIALQISNWNSNRVENEKEIEILTGLQKTLKDDRDEFNAKFLKIQVAEARIQRLQDLIRSGTKVDSLNVLCGAVYGAYMFNLNTSFYEMLKSNGFDLIKNDSIRNLTVKIFDTHLKYLLGCNDIEFDVVTKALRPYYLSNFSNIRFYETADPNNMDALYKDKYYQNLIDYRLTVIRNNITSYYPNIIKDLEELILRLDEYLEKR